MKSDHDSQPAQRLRPGARVAAVVSSYHAAIVGRMAARAHDVLLSAGLESTNWFEVEAPGAFELPLIAQELLRTGRVDAVLCFGLVLKGETSHDQYIASAISTRLLDLSLESGVPVLFGVLTTNDVAQAERRAATEAEGGLDKGREVALAAVGVLTALDRAADAFADQTEPGRAGSEAAQ